MPNIKLKYLLPIVIGALALFFVADARAGFLGDIGSSITSGISKHAGQLGVGAGLLAMFIASDNGCWFCKVYADLFDTMNSLSGMIATEMADDFLMLLAVGVLFYLVFKIGATVVKLQEVDLMQFLGELFKQLGRAIIAAAFLAGSVEMYKYLISPFLAFSLGLTNMIVVKGNLMVEESGGIIGKVQSFLTEGLGSLFGMDMDESAIPQMTGAALENQSTKLPFSIQLREQIVGMLRLCSVSAISGMVLGGTIAIAGLLDTVFFPNFQLLVVGLLILGSYFAIFLAVPFKLIDVMVRLCFVAALTPLWILLWVFPATASYTKSAWEMLLNCCACFICMGVIMVMVFQIMAAMNPLNSAGGLLELGAGILGSGLGFGMFKGINILSPTVLKTLALGMLATSMIKGSSQIATQIVKSYGANIGDGMDKQMADSMKGLGGAGAMLGGLGMGALAGTTQGMKDFIGHVTNFGGAVNSDVRKATQGDASGGTKGRTANTYTGDTGGGNGGGNGGGTGGNAGGTGGNAGGTGGNAGGTGGNTGGTGGNTPGPTGRPGESNRKLPDGALDL